MAYIQKVERKKTRAAYKVHYVEPRTGKRRSKTFIRRKQAQHFIENIPKTSFLHERDSCTLEQAGLRWLEVCERYGRNGHEPVEASTLRKYRSHHSILCELEGQILLCQLDAAYCEQVQQKLLDSYSRPYAKKLLTSFKGILAQAVTDGRLFSNPAKSVRILDSSRDGPKHDLLMPALSEVKQMLQTADAQSRSNDPRRSLCWTRYKMFFETLSASGMRPGECLGLPWQEVDFDNQQIRVSQDLNEDLSIGRPKSQAGYRTIPMPAQIMQSLKQWKSLCPNSEYNLVFPNWQGNPESAANITSRGWRPLQERTGLIQPSTPLKYPLKSLRHLRASLEIHSGANPKEVMRLMGHSSIKVTFDVYGHLFPEHDDGRAARAELIYQHLH